MAPGVDVEKDGRSRTPNDDGDARIATADVDESSSVDEEYWAAVEKVRSKLRSLWDAIASRWPDERVDLSVEEALSLEARMAAQPRSKRTINPAHNEWGLFRVRKMLSYLLGEEKVHFANSAQRPYSFYMPFLDTQPFPDRVLFPWLEEFEGQTEMIQGELLAQLRRRDEAKAAAAAAEAVAAAKKNDAEKEEEEEEGAKAQGADTMTYDARQSEHFEEYYGDGVQEDKGAMVDEGGDWRVYYFSHNFHLFHDHISECPKTWRFLNDIGHRYQFMHGMVCFSAIEAGTHIKAHFGPSNVRYTCHLGLHGCQDTTMIVAGQKRPYLDGRVLILDDSYAHEVRHNGPDLRVTLMFDVWHPEMSLIEIEAFKMILALGHNEDEDSDMFYHSLYLMNPDDEDTSAEKANEENDNDDDHTHPEALLKKLSVDATTNV